MKVCVVGFGNQAEKNIKLFKNKHVVTLYVPIPISVDESMELRQRVVGASIFYEASSVANCDVYIICVDVKYNTLEQRIDTQQLTDTVMSLRQNIREGCTIILETTVGVGITRSLFTGLNFQCSYSPSNFDPSNITDKAEELPKLVGGMDEESEILAMQFYETVYNNVIRTGSPEVAEAAIMLHHAKKTMEDALMNEFSDFCDRVPGLDIHKVIDATTTGSRDPKATLPWIGRTVDTNSQHLMSGTGVNKWPVLSIASEQLVTRPSKIYKSIVDKYCGEGKFDKLHKMAFLVIGVGNAIGSPDTKDSPVLEIIRYLEMEGALVHKYDMFIDKYSELPEMKHNSGRDKFDGILVMHPYNVSMWKKYKQTTFYCRH